MDCRFFSKRALAEASSSAPAGAVRRSRSTIGMRYLPCKVNLLALGTPGGREHGSSRRRCLHCVPIPDALKCAPQRHNHHEWVTQGDRERMTPAIEPAYRRSTGLVDV